MTQDSSTPSPLGRLWKTLTSLRLTLVLLIILALVGLVGTVRAQVFDTFWFLGPLGVLILNLIACLIRGLPLAVHRCRQPFTPAAALELPERARFQWPANPDPDKKAERALRRELGPVRKEAVGEQTVYFWERGRFRPLGPYVVHLALLVILTGALMGKFLGVEGQLTLMEGETAKDFISGDKEKPLDFQAHLDHFQVLYYPDGTPREFRSDLTLTMPGKAPKKVVCRVNEPVSFGNYTFYQSSYGNVLRLEVKEGENSRIVKAPVGQTMLIPDSQTHFRVLEYQPDLIMPAGDQERHLGPAARLVYWGEDGRPRLVVILENHPEMAVEHQPGPYHFYLKGTKSFSVLQVKHDPGVWWVYAGFLLLLPGFYLAFLRPAERWALVLRRHQKGAWEARLLGAAPRARETFQDRLERLRELLKKGGTA